MSPCTCYYIEVPYDLATSGGQDLYVVYINCDGQSDSSIALNLPTINLGDSFAFYICSSILDTPTFKYGFFGETVLIEGITVTDTGNICTDNSTCYPAVSPEPSATPTQTPTNTSTQTPTNTPTVTQTNTGTQTPTPTPTPTSPLQLFSVTNGVTSNDACNNGTSVTIYAFDPLFDQNSQFYNDPSGIVVGDMSGFYSDGPSVVELDSSGSVISPFELCSSIITPTPTPTETSTPTPTPTVTQSPTPTFGYYTYSLGTGATANDACTAFSSSPQTIYGSVAGGIGPNVGEFLYETAGIPLTDVAPDGFYSNGTAWFQITGGLGEITSSSPFGCL